jgi:hypothetical protein
MHPLERPAPRASKVFTVLSRSDVGLNVDEGM